MDYDVINDISLNRDKNAPGINQNLPVNTNWQVMGCFGRTHGIKGKIHVNSFTVPCENILTYMPWYILLQQTRLSLNILNYTANEKLILVQVQDFDTLEKAAILTNIPIEIYYTQLPKLADNEYYWNELIGMKVINMQGSELGTVIEIMPTVGAHDILVIKGTKQYFIPYIPNKFVNNVDRQLRLITVDWGLDF